MSLDEHEDLTFRRRPDWQSKRRPRRSSTWPWLVVGLIAAIAFVFVIRELLARTAWSAGASPASETTQSRPIASSPDSAADETESPQRQVPSVYRCVDRAGAVSLQSQPCGPDQRTTRVVAAPPEVEPIRPRQAIRQIRTAQIAYNTVEFPQQDALAGRKAACAAARRQRESILEQVGLKRTYDLLQRLDEMVNGACKGL